MPFLSSLATFSQALRNTAFITAGDTISVAILLISDASDVPLFRATSFFRRVDRIEIHSRFNRRVCCDQEQCFVKKQFVAIIK
jgi:hypothetical protein